MTKPELRELVRERLRTAALPELAAASEAICRHLAALPAWKAARLAAVFVPMVREPQIQRLWQTEGGPTLCFPQLRDDEVVLLRVENRALLAGADWRLASPEFAACEVVAPEALDLILVPGLAFTRDGRRLGRGGGWYDRLLAACSGRTRRVGVCFERQIVSEIPSEPHDQRVEAVITEEAPLASRAPGSSLCPP